MTSEQRYALELKEKINKIKYDEDYISSLLRANFGSEQHNMLIGEKNFREFFASVSNEFFSEISTFEKVDLIDYWNFVNGRTNKKR